MFYKKYISTVLLSFSFIFVVQTAHESRPELSQCELNAIDMLKECYEKGGKRSWTDVTNVRIEKNGKTIQVTGEVDESGCCLQAISYIRIGAQKKGDDGEIEQTEEFEMVSSPQFQPWIMAPLCVIGYLYDLISCRNCKKKHNEHYE